jgi:hypothetical protein
MQIVTYAFRDGAFLNDRLTPELIWQLKVPKHLRSLPLRWKKNMLDIPVLRRVVRTPYNYAVHRTLPMTYDSSRLALINLGEDAKFEDRLSHYNFRRWTANEANRKYPYVQSPKPTPSTPIAGHPWLCHIKKKVLFIAYTKCALGHFTDQERNRVLGQSGTRVFERHYQSEFVKRDLQHVVLLRPPQESLLKRAAGMLKNRDPFAPSDITGEQLQGIRQHPRILALRQEKKKLKDEMRSLAGTMGNAREPFPELYSKHDEADKELTRLRKIFRDEAKAKARKDYFHSAPVLEIDKQIDLLLGGDVIPDESEDPWNPPISEYIFAERARLVDAFYGPEAESFDEKPLLDRRIQATKDLVAFAGLCEPPRRGKRVNWDDDDNDTKEGPYSVDASKCPTDMCIVCSGQSRSSSSNPPPRKYKWKSSLQRHLMDTHLNLMIDGIHCTWPTCRNIPPFPDDAKFLNHAATVHDYDLGIRLGHKRRRVKK